MGGWIDVPNALGDFAEFGVHARGSDKGRGTATGDHAAEESLVLAVAHSQI